MPEAVDGHVQKPLEGVSFASSLADPNVDTGKHTQFYSMLGTRAIWHQGWKAATAVPACPAYWGPFDEQRWELFDTDNDPSECHDLAEQHPDKLKELAELWWAEAKRYQALPLETRNAVEALTTPRPQPSKPRDRYIYHADGAAVPESVAPNIRGLVHNRGRTPRRYARGRRRAVRAGQPLRRSRALREGWQAQVRL
jgi:hypothetical protein